VAGRSSSIDVFLSLHGQRKFSKEVAASGAELEAMGLKGAKAMARFAASGEKLKKFGKSWTHNISLPVAGLGVIAGGMAVNFKRQMGLVETDAGGAAKEVKHLEKSVLGLSRESQYGPQSLAESLFHVESSGYRGAKAMKVLNASQKLATVGNSELEATTYALVSATRAIYGASGEGLSNVNRTAAELNGIVAHGDMRLEELTSAMSTGVIPKAKSMGIGLRGVGAAMDVMTTRGLPAQRAAYALGFTMSKLIPAGEKAESAFESIGLGEESLVKAAKGPGGYVSTLEVLKSHLKSLPTEAQRTKKLNEMFGGGRMTAGLLIDLQNLGEMKKIYGELGAEVGKYAKHVKDAEEQPLVKLKKAWSGIQASLVEIGNDLVPLAGPGLEKAAKLAGTLTHDFLALPGPAKAAAVGFLLLTGPVASGLGYFANGVGRALILTRKLASAGQDAGAFAWALKSGGQSVKGAASYAFRGSGVAGALQTAKGFAYSLGPAVAAYGIGNILTSAISGDWVEAGAEGGMALAGGLMGFALGGPMGAMLGVGIGSLGGELFSGFVKSGSGLPNLQERIASSSKGLKSALEQEHQAAEGLARSGKHLVDARQHQKTAAQGLKRAEHSLEAARANAPAGSRAIAKAEVGVAKAIERVTRAKKAAKRAERKKGEERAIAKEGFRYAALEERHRKSLLTERIRELRTQKQSVAAHAAEGEKLQKLRPINEALIQNMGRLHSVNKQANETQKEAADQIGPKFAGFLRKASREALNLGSALKVQALRQREVNEESEAYIQARGEGFKTIGEAESPSRTPSGKRRGEHGAVNPLGGGHHLPARRRSGAASTSSASQKRLTLEPGALAGVVHVHVRNENTLKVDGKKLAEVVTHQSQKSANRG
jgi:TP901 family phage tail tape measure protein